MVNLSILLTTYHALMRKKKNKRIIVKSIHLSLRSKSKMNLIIVDKILHHSRLDPTHPN
jgi:hypothetical protein